VGRTHPGRAGRGASGCPHHAGGRGSRTAGGPAGGALRGRGRPPAGWTPTVGRPQPPSGLHHERGEVATLPRSSSRTQPRAAPVRDCGLPPLARRAAAHHPAGGRGRDGPHRRGALPSGRLAVVGARPAPGAGGPDHPAAVPSGGGPARSPPAETSSSATSGCCERCSPGEGTRGPAQKARGDVSLDDGLFIGARMCWRWSSWVWSRG